MPLLTIISVVGVIGLIVLGAFVLSVVRGAGTEIGRAGLAEASPWIAKFSLRLALRVSLFRRPDLFNDLQPEMQTLVEETFRERQGAADRARGIFVVLREAWGLATAASDLRNAPASASQPKADPESSKLSEAGWELSSLPPRIPEPGPIPAFDWSTLQAMESAAGTLRAPADEVAKMLAAFDANRFAKSLDMMNSGGMLAAVESVQKSIDVVNSGGMQAAVESLQKSIDVVNSGGMLAAVESLQKHFRGWR